MATSALFMGLVPIFLFFFKGFYFMQIVVVVFLLSFLNLNTIFYQAK